MRWKALGTGCCKMTRQKLNSWCAQPISGKDYYLALSRCRNHSLSIFLNCKLTKTLTFQLSSPNTNVRSVVRLQRCQRINTLSWGGNTVSIFAMSQYSTGLVTNSCQKSSIAAENRLGRSRIYKCARRWQRLHELMDLLHASGLVF